MDHRPKDKCGVFAITNHKAASHMAYLGLYSLQHRGQESAGIAVYNEGKIDCHRGMGLVSSVFKEDTIARLKGQNAIGHVRYSTTGSSTITNAQPFCVETTNGVLAIAHNGNLVNAHELKKNLEDYGSIFQTTIDTEVIVHLIARSRKSSIEERVVEALGQCKGAYSIVMMHNKKVMAIKDPCGFRPLCIGKVNGSWVFASESCSLDLIGAEYVREVENGELVIAEEGKELRSIKMPHKEKKARCIFEFIYFSRPDSKIFGKSVYETRKRLGAVLAKESHVDADLVSPIPDSGMYAALGYAEESKLPFDIALTRNHYIGRTFISPFQTIRDLGVKIKLNPIKEVVGGKRIVIIEDSIVRGTTSKARIKTLRDAGAKEIHMRVSCPPHRFPCPYGIDFPTQSELIAAKHSTKEIEEYLELDSLAYLTYEGMLDAMMLPKEEFCTSCFSGEYPLEYNQSEYQKFVKKEGC